MKQKFSFLLLWLLLACTGQLQAQCGAAQSISVGVGSCNSVLFTNVGASTVGNPATPPCWTPNTMSHTAWFSFVATSADIELSTNFSGALADTQIAVYSGGCGSLTLIGCQEDINTATNLLHTDVILHGLTIGNTYYIAVDGKGNTTGTFGVCAQQTLPVGPALPLQDCATAQTLCGLGNISVPDGPGGVGTSQEAPSCFGAPGERSSNWYTFTAATNGNLCFTINPNSNIDYDFAVYNTTTSCPGTELTCNWSPTSPTTGLGCTGVQCETCLAVVAGQTYSILVDRFTAASTSGFVMDFAGTTAAFASPNPTFTASTVCVGTPTAFTNTTNGNFTYSWNFGDGFTSSLENPTHTYAAAGTYNVRLLVTAVPGGCQNSITQSVTVSAPPTVDAGSGSTICPGSCFTLGGSTNATGSVGSQPFNNLTDFAIPDGSTAGINSPINVSGILPATISATTIQSVCINLTHTWDSDLDIFLVSPDGTMIELSTGNGPLGNNYTNTCFTPTATNPITGGTAPYTGNWIPEQPFSNLNGHPANGTWNLLVVDDVGGDSGSILDWTLVLNNNIPPFTWSPTTAMTNANTLSPTVCPSTTTTYTLTANNPGGCVTTDTVTVTVGGATSATIAYSAAAYCNTDTPKTVTITGTTGGSFSSTAGLTIDAVTGTITPATSTVGTYTVTYTIPASGGCPIFTTTASVIIRAQPNAGADGSTTICDSNTAPINLFNLISGEQTGGIWTRNSGTGGTLNPATGIFTPIVGVTASTFTYTMTGISPCSNDTSTVNVLVNPQPNAGTDGSTLVCDSNTAPIDLFGLITGEQTGGTWTRDTGTGGTFNAGAGTFAPASGSTSSTFTYTVNGTLPCLLDTSSVAITIVPVLTPTVNCGTSTTSSVDFAWAGVPGATGYTISYQVNANPVVNTGPIGNVLTFSVGSLSPGENVTITVTPTGAVGTCFNVGTQTCTAANCVPPTANISYGAASFCTSVLGNQTVTLTGTGVFNTGAYSSTAGLTINTSTGEITPGSSTPGNYTVTYTIAANAGCPAVIATTAISIEALPVLPVLTPTHPTCSVATGTVTITGVAGLTYSFDGSAYTPTLIYSGLAAGSSHTVTAQNAAGCISAIANITLNGQPATPAIPTLTATQPTCSVATGTVTITWLPGLTYSFDGSAYTPTLIYSGLAAGSSHTVTAQNAAGCISAIANITLNAQPATPAIPALTATQPTCALATGTVTITGIAGLTYSFDGSAYTPTLIYSGLPAGSSHTVTAQNAAGCISPIANITLNGQPATPAIPTLTATQPTCSVATGTVTITGLPGLTYSFDGSAYTPTLIYSGLVAGSSHTVTAQNAAGCISPIANITLNAQPATPAIPALTATQPTCALATGTVTITGLPGLTYSFDGSAYTPTLIYSGLAAGSSHTVTAQNAAGCISPIANITLNAQPATPAIPALTATQPTCALATGTVTITGLPGLTYSFDGSAYTPTLIYSGLAAGSSHTVTAQNAAGCISASASIMLNIPLNTPATPVLTVTQPTCTTANGTITITLVPGEDYSFDGNPYAGVLVYSGLAAGSTHTVTAKNTAGCISSVATVTLNAQPQTPAIPTLTATQPTCSVATGTITITGVAGLTYSFDGSPYMPTLIYSGLTAGTSHTVTAQNAAGCISAIANISLNAQPFTPSVPILTATEPTCTVATGAIDIIAVPGMSYSFDGGAYSGTTLFTGLAAGSTHTVTAQNASGCISPIAALTLSAQPTTPAMPVLAATQPTCTVATGTVSITGIAGLAYSLDGGSYAPTLIYPGLAAGSHTVTAQNAAGCISPLAAITINAQPATPAAPVLSAIQPTCTDATGTITINGLPGLTYSFDGGAYNTTLIHSGLAAGSSHTVTTKNVTGCISAAANLTLSAQPATPVALATPNAQTICSGSATSINLSAIAGTTFNWTVSQTGVNGAIAGSGNAITQILTTTGTAAGQAVYTITPTANGCTGLPISVTITVNPLPRGTASPAAHVICSGETIFAQLNSIYPGATFSWTVSTMIGASGATPGSGNTISQQLFATNTSSQPGRVIYSITPTANGCAGIPFNVTVSVKPRPRVFGPGIVNICDGATTAIYLSPAANFFNTSYSWTVTQVSGVTGAANGTGRNILQTLTLTGNSPGSVIYTVIPREANCDGDPKIITVNVYPPPNPILVGGNICVEQSSGNTIRSYILDSGLNNATHHFEWTHNGVVIPGATSSTYEARLAGDYSVVATNNQTSCVSSEVFTTVTAIFIPTAMTATGTDAFSENASIVVNVVGGTGPFLYQLANGPLQTSNVFSGLGGGTYTVKVIDEYGCTDLETEVTLIDYPKFFTPNGDGYNDFWNIFSLSEQPAEISIFDRYGKLVKQISTRGVGWDGTYNGQLLPSTDYWFTVDYTENKIPKIFKAHFSLKR
jgi:gliding motility-associated-like protein